MQQIKQWFNGLDSSEQRIVLIAAIFFSLVILIFAIIKPLNDSVNRLETQVNSRQLSVSKWQQAMPQILASNGQSSAGMSSLALSSVITRSTKKFGLNVSRVQEKNNNEIQVWLDNVPFNDFLRWVTEMQNQYSIKVDSANVRSKERDGLISIDIKLKKG